MPTKGFNLIGYATSPLGLGEDLRSFASMLDYLQIPFSVIDLPTESQRQVKVSWKHLSEQDFDTSIFFMSAGTCLRLAELHPTLFSQPKMKLGYFLWELPDIHHNIVFGYNKYYFFINQLKQVSDNMILISFIFCSIFLT